MLLWLSTSRFVCRAWSRPPSSPFWWRLCRKRHDRTLCLRCLRLPHDSSDVVNFMRRWTWPELWKARINRMNIVLTNWRTICAPCRWLPQQVGHDWLTYRLNRCDSSRMSGPQTNCGLKTRQLCWASATATYELTLTAQHDAACAYKRLRAISCSHIATKKVSTSENGGALIVSYTWPMPNSK